MASRSDAETEFSSQLKENGFPFPNEEFKFLSDRRFRFDFAWPSLKIAVEIEGGVWSGGRHTRGAGYSRDIEKYNLATRAGWKVYRFTPQMVKSGEAIVFMSSVFPLKLMEE